MKNKILIIAVIVLATLLIFETGYLIGLSKNISQLKHASRRMPLYKSKDNMPALLTAQINADQALNSKIDNMLKTQSFYAQPARRLFVANMMTSGETEKDYVITFNLPGFKKDEINIEVSQGRLTIFASTKKEAKLNKKGLYQESLSTNNFVQSVKLPQNIVSKDILASYNLDTLVITIPKSKEAKSEGMAKVRILVK